MCLTGGMKYNDSISTCRSVYIIWLCLKNLRTAFGEHLMKKNNWHKGRHSPSVALSWLSFFTLAHRTESAPWNYKWRIQKRKREKKKLWQSTRSQVGGYERRCIYCLATGSSVDHLGENGAKKVGFRGRENLSSHSVSCDKGTCVPVTYVNSRVLGVLWKYFQPTKTFYM